MTQVLKTPNAGFVRSRSNRESRLEREEAELQALMAKEAGQNDEQEEDTEDTTNEAPQTEDTTNQEDTEQELTPEEKTFKKRYGDLRAHAAKQKKELEDRIKELEEKSGTPSLELPEEDEDITTWKKKYPDVARIVEKMAEQIADQKFQKAKLSLDEIQKAQIESKQERAKKEIRKAHPDFDNLQASDAFHDWVEEQSTWIQNALYENSDDAKAVIRVLDLYRIDNPKRKTKRQEADEASEVTTKSSKRGIDTEAQKGVFTESQVNKMGDKWYAENAAAIDEAIRTGKFVYDISGSAR